MYRHFEHTADLGLRVEARDLAGLFQDAARGLFAMIVDDLDSVRPKVERRFEIAGKDRAYLLFDWLAELLTTSDTEGLLFSQFEVRIDDAGLNGVARGGPIDRTRHSLEHEVKAITYHALSVEERDGLWTAEVIVDI